MRKVQCGCPQSHEHDSFEGISYGYQWCKEDGCKCHVNYAPQHYIDKLAKATTITLGADGSRAVTQGL